MTTTDARAAEEAEALHWARRRRLLTEVGTVGYAVGYGALVIGRQPELVGLAVAFPFLAVGIRAAVWRWRDRAVEAGRARVGYALRRHRLVGWARAEQVGAEARERVGRAWWRRCGMGLALAAFAGIAVLGLLLEPAEPGFSVFSAALLVWALADLARQEQELRDARRWLADPPG